MKISNKNIIIIIALVVIILLGWSWLNQIGYFESNSEEVEIKNEENEDSASNEITEADNPQIRVVFPTYGAILNPGPLMVRYLVSGKIEEIQRVDLTLFLQGGEVQNRSSSFDRESKTGGYLFPNLSSGEYRLNIRLVKNDGTYFTTPFSNEMVIFQIKAQGSNNQNQ